MMRFKLLVRMEIETPAEKEQRLMLHATAKAFRRKTANDVYPMLANAASAINYEVTMK